MKLSVFLCVLELTLSYIRAQKSDCRLPDGGIGICKFLKDCPTQLKEVESINYVSIDLEKKQSIQKYLQERVKACGGGIGNLKLCCSDCTNPDGKNGFYVPSLDVCPSLKELLKGPPRGDVAVYVNKSRSKTSALYCCGPPRAPVVDIETRSSEPTGSKCDSAFSSLPDPATKCCGRTTELGSKITNGNASGIRAHPWVVLFEFEGTTCGGTLITNKHVITAAHCLKYYNNTPKSARVGELDREVEGPDCDELPDGSKDCTDGAQNVPLEAYLLHPEYNDTTQTNDVALIRLAEPVHYTPFVRPLCLPTLDYSIERDGQLDDQFEIVGWGRNSNNTLSRYKQEAKVNYVDYEKCRKAHNRINNTIDKRGQIICAAGKQGQDSCAGDSGGPLVATTSTEHGTHYELAGIVSTGRLRCGHRGYPAIYTNVHTHIKWIRQNVRDHSGPWIYV